MECCAASFQLLPLFCRNILRESEFIHYVAWKLALYLRNHTILLWWLPCSFSWVPAVDRKSIDSITKKSSTSEQLHNALKTQLSCLFHSELLLSNLGHGFFPSLDQSAQMRREILLFLVLGGSYSHDLPNYYFLCHLETFHSDGW